MEENVLEEEEGSRWTNLFKLGSLAGAAAPWLLFGYMLVNATRPPSQMAGFSGYVSNPGVLTGPSVGTDQSQYYNGQKITWTAENCNPTHTYQVGLLVNGVLKSPQSFSGVSVMKGTYQVDSSMAYATVFELYDVTKGAVVWRASVLILSLPAVGV